MNLKTEKDFNSFKEYESYVQGLIAQRVLCEGCIHCMYNGGCDCLEDAVELSKGDWVRCTPMSYVPEELNYPKSCIIDWYGENYIKDNCHNQSVC